MEEDNIAWLNVEGERRLCTKNLVPGIDVYGERLISTDGEYRVWDPFRSKLAAAIINGLKEMPIKYGSKVLYIGASTGTTVSHVSDIVGADGIVFAIELAPRVAREMLDRVASKRDNVIPVIEDARKVIYYGVFGKVDVIYSDIAQPDQTEIAIANCVYLKKNGYLILVIKSRSIDVTKEPKEIIEQEVSKLKKNGFTIEQVIDLKPFDKDHAVVIARR